MPNNALGSVVVGLLTLPRTLPLYGADGYQPGARPPASSIPQTSAVCHGLNARDHHIGANVVSANVVLAEAANAATALESLSRSLTDDFDIGTRPSNSRRSIDDGSRNRAMPNRQAAEETTMHSRVSQFASTPSAGIALSNGSGRVDRAFRPTGLGGPILDIIAVGPVRATNSYTGA